MKPKQSSFFAKLEAQAKPHDYYLKNQEKRKETFKVWYENNKSRHISSVLSRQRKQDNSAIFGHACCQRFYDERDSVTKETGILHHVDHIIPITHKHVCGLHVPANLRVIPATLNWSKHNSWTSDWN